MQGMVPGAYSPPKTTSITGLPVPVKELPVTVNTISAQFLDDMSAKRLRDIVGYVPGVNASDDSGATGDLLNIRGFDFLYQTYINGMRNRTSFNSSRRFANIDRIEIFKGPGGVEFGAGDPGGFVNLVTKKPESVQSTTVGVEAGSYDSIRGFVDTTGPLTRQGAPVGADPKSGMSAPESDDLGLFYRLIASGDSANSFRDAFHTDGYEIAPSLLWKYAPGSSLLVEFDYQFRDQPYDRGTVYMKGAGFKDNFAPINTSFHEPGDYYNNTNTRTSVYWTNKINDTFTLRVTGEVDTNRGRGVGVRNPYTFLLYDDNNVWNGSDSVLRTTQNIQQDIWSVGLKPELLINFDTGAVKNTGLLGFNYAHTSTKTATQDGFDLRPISFPVPVYGQPHVPNTGIPSIQRNFRFGEELDEYGLYYQHKADFGSRFHLLAGLRYDWYDDDTVSSRNVRTTPIAPLYSISDGNLSYRIGGVVDLTKNFSLYGGYSNSFQPQSGILSDGGSPDALEATAWEAGIKGSFLNDRLQTTLSVYDTERKNLLETDPRDPDFLIPLGTVDVRGVEFEVTGKVTEDLDVQGGFAFMDTEIKDTEDATTRGNKFYNVPDFQAGLRVRYDTSRWLVKGLSVGAGAVYVGSREGDAINSFELPSYLRFDTGVYYHWRNWDFKLTCENLGDSRYFLASQGSADIIQPGAPRLFTLGATMKF